MTEHKTIEDNGQWSATKVIGHWIGVVRVGP